MKSSMKCEESRGCAVFLFKTFIVVVWYWYAVVFALDDRHQLMSGKVQPML